MTIQFDLDIAASDAPSWAATATVVTDDNAGDIWLTLSDAGLQPELLGEQAECWTTRADLDHARAPFQKAKSTSRTDNDALFAAYALWFIDTISVHLPAS